jgi:hypothetical protein
VPSLRGGGASAAILSSALNSVLSDRFQLKTPLIRHKITTTTNKAIPARTAQPILK